MLTITLACVIHKGCIASASMVLFGHVLSMCDSLMIHNTIRTWHGPNLKSYTGFEFVILCIVLDGAKYTDLGVTWSKVSVVSEIYGSHL